MSAKTAPTLVPTPSPVFYTGVGNRICPPFARALCGGIGAELAARGLTLRTGDAKGIDTAFYLGASGDCDRPSTGPEPEVYAPAFRQTWDRKARAQKSVGEGEPPAWALALARSLLGPQELLKDRPASTWALFARNMQQVLGTDGQTPSRFLLAWTHYQDSAGTSAGGTRLAVRCAEDTEARAALGLPADPIPWINVNGLDIFGALAFAHEHSPRPIFRPGDLLPRHAVPDGALIRGTIDHIYCTKLESSGQVAHTMAPTRWYAWGDLDCRQWAWSRDPSPGETFVELVALGLTPATATAENLQRLAAEHEARYRAANGAA